MPEPTIGRIVLANLGNVHPPHRNEPFPAIVVGVNQNGTLELNAAVNAAMYAGRGQSNICLSNVNQGEPDGEGQRWWWPPRDAPALGTSHQPQGGGAPVASGSASDVGADGQTTPVDPGDDGN